ncbi:MAG: hypothetical protein K8H88_10010 [Sandaracinaceae bacterium]|nr:hypothetical protein [Sandaracinaceae bacterium]
MSASVEHFGWGTSQGPIVVAASTVNGLAATPYQTWAFRRAEITAFYGSPFRAPSGNMLSFASVRLIHPRVVGPDRFEALSVLAMEKLEAALRRIPRQARMGIVLCLPERMDPERANDRDRRARRRVEGRVAGPFIEAGCNVAVRVVAKGHASMAYGLIDVGRQMRERTLDLALVVGVDSYYDPYVLETLFADARVLDSDSRDAFVPGEAASALLIARPDVARQLGFEALAQIESVGTNEEVATMDNDVGNLGLGLSRPAVAICKKMKQEKQRLAWWISDMTGETFRVHELQIAWPRAAHLVMTPEDQLDALPTHLGDIGAATMPTAICIAIEGLTRGDPKGSYALVTGSSPAGARGVALVYARA